MDNQPKGSAASQVTSVVSLPGYKIIDVLGKGGMAVVYLAIQESVGRQVALKILAPDHTDETFTDRFLREARIISSLNHPNIITIYDANVHQACHYMSMEYVPGNSLREARDKLTRKQKVDVIKQVAKALDFAGKKGYVHRDIKPENILLHEDGRAILTDFGIARSQHATQGLTVTGKVIGTPYYMSPEQTKGMAVDHRSDIYSLGIVLFQALAGYLPYDGPSFVAIGIKHLSDPIPELPKGLELFQPIINTCMSKDPAHRYQTAGDLLNALEQINDSDLDFIETKVRASSKSVQNRPAKTLSTGNIPPVVSTRPGKKSSGQRSIVADAELAPDLDITDSDDYQRLKRRKRWILLLLLVVLAVAGYYKRVELNDFYQAKLAPALDPYIGEFTSESPVQPPAEQIQAEVNTPISDTMQPAVEIEPTQPTVDDAIPGTDTQGNISLSTRLAEQTPDSIRELAQQYQQQLQINPNDDSAKVSLKEIANWYVLEVNNAIETSDTARARLMITQARESLPPGLVPQQIVLAENHLLRNEAIKKHLHEAETYMKSGDLVVPAGKNAVDSLNAVLSIDPEHSKAKEMLQNITSEYYSRGKQELATGKLNEALASVELGLTVNQSDQELFELRQTIEQEIRKREKVDSLLVLADTRLQAGKAVEPKGESAVDSYKSALKLQPGNKKALLGMQKVEAFVIKQIDTAIWENKLTVGQRILASALEHFPNSATLDQAGRKLQKALATNAPRITHFVISDHNISSLLSEQVAVVVTPTLYFGFTYTNFPKKTTILNIRLESVDENTVLADKKLIVTEASGEHIFSINHPQATFIKGQYRMVIKLDNRELIVKPFVVQATTTAPAVSITR